MNRFWVLWMVTVALLLSHITISAHDFMSNGVYYKITSETDLAVEVISKEDAELYVGSIIIPETIEYNGKSYSVTSIGVSAFEKSNLTSITIPKTVKNIRDNAFRGCNNLTDVYISDLVSWCKIEFQNSGSVPLEYAKLYLNDKEVSNLVIPESVTEIKNYAFLGCFSLVSVIIPNSVTSIGDLAFNGCHNLKNITVSDSLRNIGNSVFSYTEWWRTQSNDLLYLNNYLFGYRRNSLKGRVTIKEGTRIIADYAFADLSKLTSVVIPNTVEHIGNYAFRKCSELTSIAIPNSVKSIGNSAFKGCSNLTSVSISNSITRIEDYTFSGCAKLTSMTIPNTVTNIGVGAFSSCN